VGAPVPVVRGSVAAAASEGRLVVLGGQDASRTYADAHAYDPEADLPPMALARHGFGAATWGGAVYALYGGPQPGLSVTGSVERLGPA
jgi:hypothetical protein